MNFRKINFPHTTTRYYSDSKSWMQFDYPTKHYIHKILWKTFSILLCLLIVRAYRGRRELWRTPTFRRRTRSSFGSEKQLRVSTHHHLRCVPPKLEDFVDAFHCFAEFSVPKNNGILAFIIIIIITYTELSVKFNIIHLLSLRIPVKDRCTHQRPNIGYFPTYT